VVGLSRVLAIVSSMVIIIAIISFIGGYLYGSSSTIPQTQILRTVTVPAISTVTYIETRTVPLIQSPTPTPTQATQYLDELIANARKEGKLNILGMIPAEQIKGVIDAFKARYPFIDVSYLRLPPGEFGARVQTELRAGKLTFDLLIPSGPSPQLIFLLDNKVLQPYRSPSLQGLPKELIAGDYEAFAIVGASVITVLSYNKNLVPPDKAPKSFKELVDSPNKGLWAGRLGWVDPKVGGSVWMGFFKLYQLYGDGWFRNLSALKPGIETTNVAVEAKVVSGEYAVGWVFDYMAFPDIAKGAPIGIVYPEDLLVLTRYWIGITKDADHPNAAKLFIEFLLSQEAQRALVEKGYLWSPLYKDLKPLPQVQSIWAMKNIVVIPLDEYRNVVLKEFTDQGVLGKIVKAMGLG